MTEWPCGILGVIKELGTIVWSVWQDIFGDISPFRRVLFTQMLVIIVSIELLRPDRTDLRLSILLGLVKIGLVADCTSIVILRIRRLSNSNRTLALLLHKAPFVTAPFMELAVVIITIKRDSPSSANRYLIGSIYAKALIIGAMSFVLHGLRPGLSGAGMRVVDSPTVFQLVRLSAVLFLAAVPRIRSMFQVPREMAMLTIATGDGQWISYGALVFPILHIGIGYYFGTWRDAAQERTAKGNRNGNDNNLDAREWIVLLICVGALKAGAVLLVRGLQEDAHALALVPGSIGDPMVNGVLIDFFVIPLAVTAVDHLADIKTAHAGDIVWSWTNLIQSALQTYFFVRPLAALAGHDIDPNDGRVGMGICFSAIATWVSLPGVPSRFLNCFQTRTPADTRSRFFERSRSHSGVHLHLTRLCNSSRAV